MRQAVREAVASHDVPAPLTDSLDDAVAAADYALARIGSDNAQLLAASLSAGWLTDDEYEILRPLAIAVSWIAGLDTPQHRGRS